MPIKNPFRRKQSVDLSKATQQELLMLSRMPFDTKERNFIENRLGVPIHKFSDFSSFMETGHRHVWATYRSCKLISSVIVSADFKIKKEGEEDFQPPVMLNNTANVDSTIAFSLGGFLVKPNPYDSWTDLIEMTVFHLELVGNAYWLKDEADMLGRPTSFFPLLPQHIQIVPDRFDKVSKYIYKINGIELEYDPSEVIHFKTTNPTDLIYGMGSIEPAQNLYQQFINKGTLEEKFIENGAQVSGVLTREDMDEGELSEEEWSKFKRKFNLEYTGKKNAGKVAFLNGKWAYHKLGLSYAEMQALEREKWTVEQIFMNHSVPLSIAGIQSAANYATAKQDEINFRKYKIVPLIDAIVGRINSDGFIQKTDPLCSFGYELSGLIDVKEIVEEFKPLVDCGVVTRNELRERIGLAIIEDDPSMDEFTVSGNVVPLSMMGFSEPIVLDATTVGDNHGANRRVIDVEGDNVNADDIDGNEPPVTKAVRRRSKCPTC